MSTNSVSHPYPLFSGSDGKSLNNGYVYIGASGQDPESNQITVYWDAALTVPALQPLRTVGGFISRSGSPSRIYTVVEYSISVKDSQGIIVCTSLSGNSTDTSEITFTQSGSGSVVRTVEEKLNEVVSIEDKGALGDDSTDNYVEIQAAIDDGTSVLVPPGTFRFSQQITNPSMVPIYGPGKFVFTGSGEHAMIFGAADGSAHQYDNAFASNIHLERLTKDWSDEYGGVCLFNCYQLDITIHSRYFYNPIYLQGFNSGCAYNHIKLLRAADGVSQVLLHAAGSTGFVNQNTFTGGRFSTISSTDDALDISGVEWKLESSNVINGNQFINPSFELNNTYTPISVSSGTFTTSTKTLTKAGVFSGYTFRAGDRIKVTAGTGVTQETYEIASKVDSDSITLTADIGGTDPADVDANINGATQAFKGSGTPVSDRIAINNRIIGFRNEGTDFLLGGKGVILNEFQATYSDYAPSLADTILNPDSDADRLILMQNNFDLMAGALGLDDAKTIASLNRTNMVTQQPGGSELGCKPARGVIYRAGATDNFVFHDSSIDLKHDSIVANDQSVIIGFLLDLRNINEDYTKTITLKAITAVDGGRFAAVCYDAAFTILETTSDCSLDFNSGNGLFRSGSDVDQGGSEQRIAFGADVDYAIVGLVDGTSPADFRSLDIFAYGRADLGVCYDTQAVTGIGITTVNSIAIAPITDSNFPVATQSPLAPVAGNSYAIGTKADNATAAAAAAAGWKFDGTVWRAEAALT